MITFERCFTDGCEHPEDAYIGTAWHGREPHDVYLYMADGVANLCFRYGDEPSEYISPGSLSGVAARIEAFGNPFDMEHSYAREFRVVRHHLAKAVAEICYQRACTAWSGGLFLQLAAFADLFAIDPRD